ncbi:RraA family protein [uncultured Nitratireductor sp.]|uniref:RraA family protein n=1 Tax=uncultured Nitratireductor sp. TaxID=520953 RepID=UPI0026267B3E|nr:RraA family protein [uncultured Nitratireductor sp.]
MTDTRDEELFATIRSELFTAVVGDVLDVMGLQKQFLPPRFQPVSEHMRVIGRAMPVLEADVFALEAVGGNNPLMQKPFGLMLEALDDLKTGEVYIAAGASHRYALWGELMSTRAATLGATGAVVDGFARDIDGIRALDFPTFCTGFYAQDQGPRGKVVDFRTAIEIDGIRIEPGALIFGDKEGVLVIPSEAEEETIARSLEKARGEKRVAEAIRDGMSACAAFETFGIM